MLGIRRTTVTMLAPALPVRGLIRYRRGHIVLLDRKGLEACACECYDVTRHEKLAPALGVLKACAQNGRPRDAPLRTRRAKPHPRTQVRRLVEEVLAFLRA
jgi:hypothetical protein